MRMSTPAAVSSSFQFQVGTLLGLITGRAGGEGVGASVVSEGVLEVSERTSMDGFCTGTGTIAGRGRSAPLLASLGTDVSVRVAKDGTGRGENKRVIR